MNKLLFTMLRTIFFTLLTLGASQFLSAQTWSPIKGVQAQDISIGSEGEAWIIGKDNSIMRWNGSAFDKIKGLAKRISVGADGIPWIVTTSGKIGYYDLENDKWVPVEGSAKDIGVGAEGSVWIVGTKPADGGFEVSKWNSEEESWENMEFGAIRIAVDGSGNPWMVNDEHKIIAYIEEELHEYGEETLDVGIGADGTVWAITSEKKIVKLGDDGWIPVDGNAIGIAGTSEGSPWIVNGNGQVAKLAKRVGKEESDSDEDVADANEEKVATEEKPKEIKTKIKETAKEKSEVDEENKTKTKEVIEKGASPNKPVEKPVPAKRTGTPVEFYNSGNKAVKVYASSNSQLGELVTEIRPESRVRIPVNVGEEFEVAVGEDFGRHPKIYITNTSTDIVLFGNGPLKDVQFLAEKFALLDYQPNQTGVDLTKYNPRNLVNTINKSRVFEILDVVEGVDYRIVGNGKIIKHGFEYAGTGLFQGSSEVSMSYGYSAFSKSWSVNVGGSGNIPLKSGATVSPALDFGYSEKELENKSAENTYAYTREQRSIFTITVNPQEARLDQKFKNAVRNVTDIKTANNFVSQYGTHYPTVVHYGGDRSLFVMLTREQYSKAKSFGIEVKGKVSGSIDQISSTKKGSSGELKSSKEKSSELAEGHFGINYGENREEQAVFEKAVSKYRMVGGNGGFQNWEVGEDNAAPVAAELELIYTLIDPTIFKDDSDPAQLEKAKALIEDAVTNKLKLMPLLKTPLPPPNVYTVTIEKMEVIEEIDDANKNTKGNIIGSISSNENGQLTRIGENHTLWSIDDFSLDFKFVKGTIIYPRSSYTFTNFANSSTGKFPPLILNLVGSITDKDDLINHNNEMQGQTGHIKIEDLNLSPGQSTAARSFDLVHNPNAKTNRIRITYKIRRDPSEFDDKLLQW